LTSLLFQDGFTIDEIFSLPGHVASVARKSNAKENAMSHLANVLMIVGAIVFVPGMVVAVKAYLKNRREEVAPFRHYFGYEYNRDLLRLSTFSETEDWMADPHSRFAPLRLRDSDASKRFTRISGTTQQNRERD
jgi:hypothetical protein